jgi:hypothetical protein
VLQRPLVDDGEAGARGRLAPQPADQRGAPASAGGAGERALRVDGA